MSRSRPGAVGLAVALLVGAAGCGRSVERVDGEDSPTSSGSGGGASTAGAGGAEPGCGSLCATLNDQGCFPREACVATCEAESPTWPAGGDVAFATCVEESPLCFESLEGCMLGVLHPPGTSFPIRVVGSGFSPLEGTRVVIFVDPEVLPGVVPVELEVGGGRFETTLVEPFPIWDTQAPVIEIYVDVDGDGACVPGVDAMAAEFPVWNGEIGEPAWEVSVAHPLVGDEFVCGSAP
jgi:hypothetical protein